MNSPLNINSTTRFYTPTKKTKMPTNFLAAPKKCKTKMSIMILGALSPVKPPMFVQLM